MVGHGIERAVAGRTPALRPSTAVAGGAPALRSRRVVGSHAPVWLLTPLPSLLAMIALLVSVGAMALGQESVTLRRVFTAGETERYTTTIRFEQNSMEAVLVTTEVTREVKEDGTALVATTVDSIVLRARGSEIPFPGGSGQVMLTTYDKTGKMVKQETVGGGGNVGQLLNVARPSVFVEKSLKVGETIKDQVTIGADKSRKADVTVTLLAIDKKDANTPVDCARVKIVTETAVTSPGGAGANRSEVIVRVGKADGKLVGAEGKMEGIPL
ncbi:MAG: hypothetical protein FJX72_14840, partial [Armatimonadetes bacterium]|nr:hypothetical protein [Armatimonadota bacterium]